MEKKLFALSYPCDCNHCFGYIITPNPEFGSDLMWVFRSKELAELAGTRLQEEHPERQAPEVLEIAIRTV